MSHQVFRKLTDIKDTCIKACHSQHIRFRFTPEHFV